MAAGWNERNQERSSFRRWRNTRACEQATEKTYSAEQIDGLKRLFEAHGMVVTGPPME
jgi:hypothetical protein